MPDELAARFLALDLEGPPTPENTHVVFVEPVGDGWRVSWIGDLDDGAMRDLVTHRLGPGSQSPTLDLEVTDYQRLPEPGLHEIAEAAVAATDPHNRTPADQRGDLVADLVNRLTDIRHRGGYRAVHTAVEALLQRSPADRRRLI